MPGGLGLDGIGGADFGGGARFVDEGLGREGLLCGGRENGEGVSRILLLAWMLPSWINSNTGVEA